MNIRDNIGILPDATPEQLQLIEDAWLGMEFDESKLANPFELIYEDTGTDWMQKLVWLMTQPENIHVLCKYVFNVEIPPIQSVVLQEVWKRKFPMLVASRGFGKTFLLSLYAMIRAFLIPGRKIVIVGAAFRQSKFLFEYMKTIWNNAPVLRSLCGNDDGPKFRQDRCLFNINGSVITCLPLGNGDKIRGQRANDIIADEFSCLDGDSIVETRDGMIRISDFDNADYADIITGNESLRYEKPAKFIKTPLTDVYKIKLANGYVIKCSENHKVMTNRGWKTPLEISDSDFIEQSPKGHICFGSRYVADLKEHDAWLLGTLVSEGCVTDKKRISVTTTDIKICERLVNDYNFNFNEVDGYIDKRGWRCKKAYKLWLDDERLRGQLFDWGLDYVTAHDKKIPWAILKSPEEVIRQFLSGLFDGDGSCFLWQDEYFENRIGLAYYSVSERLCRDVQVLMYKLGFDGYINSRESKISDNPQWFVRWNNSDAKSAAVYLSVDRFRSVVNNCHTTPEPKNYCWDKSRKKWKVSIVYCGKTIQKRFKCEYKAADFVNEIRSKKKYRKVVSITKLSEKQHLYDYYLPKTHSFYAEGYRQHNSIPRDIFETVVAGFANVASSPIEKVKREARIAKAKELGIYIPENAIDMNPLDKGNQIVISGTAYYDFNHFADYWRRYKKIVQSGGEEEKLREIFGGTVPGKGFDYRDYSILRIPVHILPYGFMDSGQIARARATVHSGVFQNEYGAVFSSDSTGYFKRSTIEKCVVGPDCEIMTKDGTPFFTATLKGSKNKRYVYGIDANAQGSDNFCILVLEVHGDHKRVVYAWTTDRQRHKRVMKKNLTEEYDYYSFCARKIRDLMKTFPCEELAIDSQGGGYALYEALHDKDKLQEGENMIWEVIDEDKAKDSDDYQGLHIARLINFANAEWISESNQIMRKDFEDKVILFPYFDSVTLGLSSERDNIEKREFDTLEDCVFEIEKLKDELAMIVHSQTASGRDKFDTPEVQTGPGKKEKIRKDRYCALLMANWSSRILHPQYNPGNYQGTVGGWAGGLHNNDGEDCLGPAWWEKAMKNNPY